MRSFIRMVWIVCFCLFYCIHNATLAFAEPAADPLADPSSVGSSLEETKKLLQKSLTIHEIDQEVARLVEKEGLLDSQIQSALQNIDKQDQLVQKTRERAAHVLRAYYTGERESLWLLLLSARSFSDAISLFEYLHMIIVHDYRTIQYYVQTYRELKQLHEQLVHTQTELKRIKAQFLVQRERLVQLQKELDEELKNNPEAERLQQQMKELTSLWQTKGIVVFKKYLEALTEAMNYLPEFVTNNEESLVMDGLQYIFQITDEQLKTFLRSKNPLFNNYTFVFHDDQIITEGKQDEMALTIKGHYLVEEKPANALKFKIDDLLFNGFTLPDTTRSSLQEQFELAFYPQKIASFLTATSVEIAPGLLKVMLKLNLDN